MPHPPPWYSDCPVPCTSVRCTPASLSDTMSFAIWRRLPSTAGEDMHSKSLQISDSGVRPEGRTFQTTLAKSTLLFHFAERRRAANHALVGRAPYSEQPHPSQCLPRPYNYIRMMFRQSNGVRWEGAVHLLVSSHRPCANSYVPCNQETRVPRLPWQAISTRPYPRW